MAQKKKASSPAPEKKLTKITSDKEAIQLVKERIKQGPEEAEYIVTENLNIFYGINRNAAIMYAERFGLKIFEVKV